METPEISISKSKHGYCLILGQFSAPYLHILRLVAQLLALLHLWLIGEETREDPPDQGFA